MVAVCDVLGFKNLVMNSSADVLHKQLGILRKILGFSTAHGEYPSSAPSLKVVRNQSRVGVAWFSDTILLYALDDSKLSQRNLLETVGWLLFATIPGTRVRLRAGIAYGELFVDPENESYLGKAIVEAHQLEQVQEWAGGALTPSAAEQLPDIQAFGQRLQWWVKRYPAPLKPDASRALCSPWVVDWTFGIHDFTTLPSSAERDQPTAEEVEAHPNICAKWANVRALTVPRAYPVLMRRSETHSPPF